jgi:TIR domain
LCQLMALERADVVVSVGGRVSQTANTILHLAEARQKPIVPFEFLGGASRRAFNRRKWARAYPGLDYLRLKEKDGVTDAMRIANYMVTAQMRSAHSYLWPPRNVFVSRARRDAKFEIALDDYLSSVGLTVLLGEREWPSNQMVESAIEDAVLRCDLLIVLWSRSYAASRFCYDELELALQRHRAGELQLWIINLDESDIVPRGARGLPQAVARTPHALVAVVRDLLQPVLDSEDGRE